MPNEIQTAKRPARAKFGPTGKRLTPRILAKLGAIKAPPPDNAVGAPHTAASPTDADPWSLVESAVESLAPAIPDTFTPGPPAGGPNDTRSASGGGRPSPVAVALITRLPSSPVGGQPPHAVTDEGLAVIERMASASAPRALIAKRLGISRDMLRAIERRDARVASVLEAGKAMAEYKLIAVLLELAHKGETVPLLFALKTLHGWIEGTPREAPRTNIQINLPGAMTPEQYMQSITVTQTEEPTDAR